MLDVTILLNGVERKDLLRDIDMSHVFLLYGDSSSVWKTRINGLDYLVDSVFKGEGYISINLTR